MDEDYGTPDAENQEQVEEKPDTRFEDQKKRAEKAEAEAKELREQLEALTPKEEPKEEPKPEPLTAQEKPIRFDDLADNLSVLRNLDDDEVAELQTEAKTLGVEPVKFAKSSAWQAHLEKLRANKQAESKSPEPSNRTAVFEGKTFAEVISDDKASSQSKQAAFIAQRDAILKKGKNKMI